MSIIEHNSNPPLTAMLGSSNGEVLTAGLNLKIAAQTRACGQIGGMPRVNLLETTYVIEGRFNDRGEINTVYPKGGVETVLCHRASEVDQNLVKKYIHQKCNFRGGLPNFDYSGVVDQLAACISKYCAVGKLSYGDLLGGKTLNVTPLSMDADNTVPSGDGVFIPRSITGPSGSHVFAALAAAVSATGTTTYTDWLIGRVGDPSPQLAFPADGALARACHDALMVLAQIYNDAECGSAFAYAFTKGLHRVMTVHGQCDEGGMFRDMLRAGRFGPSHGAIIVDPDKTVPIIAKPDGSVSSFRAVYVGILLATAGAASYCDEGVNVHGVRLPTVSTCLEAEASAETRRSSHYGRLLPVLPGIVSNWAKLLTSLFAINDAGVNASGVASGWAAALSCGSGWLKPRHVDAASVSLAMWINPTHVVNLADSDLPNANVFSTRYGNVGQTTSHEMFNDSKFVASTGVDFVFEYAHTTARAAPGLLLMLNHELDGIGTLRFKALHVDNLVMTRVSGENPDLSVKDAVLRKTPLSDFMWVRGTDALPHPSEMAYLNTQRIRLLSSVPQEGGRYLTGRSVTEIDLDVKVSITHYRPSSMSVGPKSGHSKKVALARQRALMTLNDMIGGVSHASDLNLAMHEISVGGLPGSDQLLAHLPEPSVSNNMVSVAPTRSAHIDRVSAARVGGVVDFGQAQRVTTVPQVRAVDIGASARPRSSVAAPGASLHSVPATGATDGSGGGADQTAGADMTGLTAVPVTLVNVNAPGDHIHGAADAAPTVPLTPGNEMDEGEDA